MANQGRVINIGSISGILSDAEWGAYQMSKHALETFSVTLAQELAPSGVQVSIIEPGSYKSDIFKNEVKRSGTGGQYVEEWTKLKEPDEVAVAVESALFEPKPKLRYMVVPNQEQAEDTIKDQSADRAACSAQRRTTVHLQSLDTHQNARCCARASGTAIEVTR